MPLIKAYELGDGLNVMSSFWVSLTLRMNSLTREDCWGTKAETVRKALKLVRRV